MNTTEQYKNLLQKKKLGKPVNWSDIAVLIDNDENALLDYLVENDLAQVNSLLHHSDAPILIGRGISFSPNVQRVRGELNQLLIKKEFGILNDIISNFIINTKTKNHTTHPELLKELQNNQTISVVSKRGLGYGGLGFNNRIS